jgi:nucleotide-binding universal stress UspA family protein
MTRGGKPGPVVVGVDHAGSANDAVDWATAGAAARDCSLRIAHVFRSPLATDAYGLAMPIDSVTRTYTAAQLVLQAAVARARSVAPDSEVSARLLTGTTARVLLDQARDAQLLVLGGRGRSGVNALLARSIAGRVVRHSPCPVVVIHAVDSELVDSPSERSTPHVVVGVGSASSGPSSSGPSSSGPSSSGPAAISFAFHAARQRGIPLTALSSWTPDPPADFETIPGSSRTAEGAARRALEQALTRWREEFPTVPVITKLVCADPVDALIATSSGAALLVVGSARRGPLRRMIVGSITRTVLREARCPVAIVSRNRTTSARTRAERTGGERRCVGEPGPIDRLGRERFWFRRASR